jgi:hypothetical protein
VSDERVPSLGPLAGIRFLSELALLAALAFIGAAIFEGVLLSVLAGVALPALAAVIWGTLVAPRAPRRLDDPARVIVELVLFAVAVLGLAYYGYHVFAIVLAALYAVGTWHGRRGG